jgi:hypothetical protein
MQQQRGCATEVNECTQVSFPFDATCVMHLVLREPIISQCASTLAGDNAMLKTVFDDFVAGLFGDRRRGRGVHCRLPARAGTFF